MFLGRTHLYEGRGVEPVVHGVRTAAAAGCRAVVLTNGCGGLDPTCGPGHPGADQRPPQPDRRLPAVGARRSSTSPTCTRPGCARSCREIDPSLQRGRLRAVPRPAVRDARRDPDGRRARRATSSGMSTVLEAIAARERGRCEVLGFSLVTNLAAGITGRAAQPRGGARGRQRGRRRGWARCSRRSWSGCDEGTSHRWPTALATGWPRTPTRTPGRRARGPGRRGASGDDGAATELADRSPDASSSAPPACAARSGAGPNRMNRVGGDPRRGRAGGVPPRPAAPTAALAS